MRTLSIAALAACAFAVAGSANAAVFVVDALGNSSTGGFGLSSLTLLAGETFTVSVSTDDLWSAGALPRYSDADGLTGDRFATASDDSGQPVGTHIGADFGLWTENGLSAPFGSLVGELGGVYRVLGTSFSGPAWSSGTLHLYYWDSNFADNFGTVSASLIAVPEAASWAMMLVGFGAAGALLRRRRVAPA
jgi:hypothetical protein